MGMERPVTVSVRIEESAKKALDALGLDSAKFLVTVERTIYGGCCGAYEERGLKVEVVEEVGDSSGFVLLKEKIPVYVHKDALELIESRGGHFAIYADLSGALYSDQ
ncbi:MAG: hypothetical protein KGI38_03695 [Thaumarchaeota archaeon]|nr:hypothetical protein [Nitrososphaerota archaeon]